MHPVRRFTYHAILSLFFILVVLAAWGITATLTFSKPDRLESWLSQSKLYDHFVATAIDQLQKSTEHPGGNSSDNGLSLSLSDPGVKQATTTAFSPAVIESAVNSFLDANYAWLDGKTATPQFKIDFTQAKASMATNIGNYVQAKLSSLPKCTTPVTVDQNFDALSATCLPRGVNPAAEGQKAHDQIANSQDFLANPVITPETLNQQQPEKGIQPANTASTQNQPYYEKLSQLPRAYRLATKIPGVVSLLAILNGIGVVFLAATKRAGLKRIGTLLISAGLVILLLILISKGVLSSIEHHAFKNDSVGQLQKSLVDFAHRVQDALIRVDLWFGVGFILAGVAIYLFLKYRWPNAPHPDKPDPVKTPGSEPPKSAPKTPTLIQL